MKKKALLFVASAMLLASCGTTEVTPTASSAPASEAPVASESQEPEVSEEPIKANIEFWENMNTNNENFVKSLIEEFQKSYPDITVKLTKVSGSYDAIFTKARDGISTNEYPDLFYGYPDSVQSLASYGKIAQLDSLIDDPKIGWSAADKKDIIPAYLEEGQSYPVEGIYSVPLAKSSEAMFYSPSLIDLDLSKVDATINGGLPLTADYMNSLTWEELFDKLCPALEQYNTANNNVLYTPSDDGKSGIVGYDSDANLFITLAEQYGYSYTSVNKQTGEASLDFYSDATSRKAMADLMVKWRGYRASRYLMTQGTLVSGYTDVYTKAKQALISIGSTAGAFAQIDTASGFYPLVAKIPHAAGKDPEVISQGPSIALMKHLDSSKAVDENRLKASWLFYKFWTNEKNSLSWAINTGYFPIRKSNLSSKAWLDYSNSNGKSGDELINARMAAYAQTIGDDLFTSPVFTGSAYARTNVGAALATALTTENLDEAGAETLLKDAYDATLTKMS